MESTFSLKYLSKTWTLDSNMILRQYDLDLLVRFMKIKSVKQKLGKEEIANKSGCSSFIF